MKIGLYGRDGLSEVWMRARRLVADVFLWWNRCGFLRKIEGENCTGVDLQVGLIFFFRKSDGRKLNFDIVERSFVSGSKAKGVGGDVCVLRDGLKCFIRMDSKWSRKLQGMGM
jgi:hypothetical protein